MQQRASSRLGAGDQEKPGAATPLQDLKQSLRLHKLALIRCQKHFGQQARPQGALIKDLVESNSKVIKSFLKLEASQPESTFRCLLIGKENQRVVVQLRQQVLHLDGRTLFVSSLRGVRLQLDSRIVLELQAGLQRNPGSLCLQFQSRSQRGAFQKQLYSAYKSSTAREGSCFQNEFRPVESHQQQTEESKEGSVLGTINDSPCKRRLSRAFADEMSQKTQYAISKSIVSEVSQDKRGGGSKEEGKELASLLKGMVCTKYAENGLRPRQKKLLFDKTRGRLVWIDREDSSRFNYVRVQDIRAVREGRGSAGFRKYDREPDCEKEERSLVVETGERVLQLEMRSRQDRLDLAVALQSISKTYRK